MGHSRARVSAGSVCGRLAVYSARGELFLGE